ncbi:MAG TPA: adenosylcobinamide-phosphate synthase CbiB [Candidatus Cybelea sp.]|nr:adenosylcobinamide-phosphate synthase CbiB [Candidatus Cybelea sp.]
MTDADGFGQMPLLAGAFPKALLLALLFDATIGYPDALFALVRHPVTWIGAMIGRMDATLNRETESEETRWQFGIVTMLAVVIAAGAAAYALQVLLFTLPLGWVFLALAASSLLAQRSLYQHVSAVADALDRKGLASGREAVAKIVGRNPDVLDEAAVCRAAIESLAENFSDGVVAPAFWFLIAGLPGIAVYKAINTADSMIGHRTPRHEAFGWAAARLDDLVNLPASRLTAALFIGAAALVLGANASAAVEAVRRDARRHRSPNAGWCEAAMAGALDLKLAGPRVYGGTRVEDAWMGEGRADATPADIHAALTLYRAACGILWAVIAMLALIFW